jgi:NADPH:quinone reductase-like Zn-dependent oxidoreductase
MKAVTVVESGVDILDVDIPKPQRNEVLVKVFACGLNRADLVVADGGAHGSAGGSGTIVGMEFSGEIVEFGSDLNSSVDARAVYTSILARVLDSDHKQIVNNAFLGENLTDMTKRIFG